MARIQASQAEMLPQSIETERALLGALLIDPDGIVYAQGVDLKAADFYREAHGWVYSVILGMAERYQSPDFVAVCDALAHRQNGAGSQLDALGGPVELTRFIDECASSVYAGHYAEIVKRRAQQRRIISACGDIAQMAHEHDGPVAELYDQASRRFFEAVDTTTPTSHLYGGDEALLAYQTQQAEREALLKEHPELLMQTGIADLDRILGDILPAYLVVVVARTSVGKTMWMEQVSEYNAMRGHPVAYYHLELTHETMLHRAIVRRLRFSEDPRRVSKRVTFQDLDHGYCGPEVARAMDAIRPWFGNMVYVHCPGWSVERICADVVRLHAKGRCDIAVVDYLQKLAMPDVKAGMNVAQLYGVMANDLKNVAEQLRIPIILGSQVSRDYKQRSDGRPHAEDIRNSGMIEEMATQIVVLHRPENTRENDPQPVEAYVEKNTQGRLGKADLVHFPGRFLLGCPAREEVVLSPEELPW